jgi:hypothetical protein
MGPATPTRDLRPMRGDRVSLPRVRLGSGSTPRSIRESNRHGQLGDRAPHDSANGHAEARAYTVHRECGVPSRWVDGGRLLT